jgi:hypothetical protein
MPGWARLQTAKVVCPLGLTCSSAWLEGRQASGDGQGGGAQPYVWLLVYALRSRVQAMCGGCGVPNWLFT